MPLYVEEQLENTTFTTTSEFFKRHSHFKSTELINSPCEKVGHVGLVYVAQREYATVSQDDVNVEVLGSEDATTCHIVVFQHKGITCLGHFDGCSTQDGINKMLNALVVSAQSDTLDRIEAHIIGGFLDDRGLSETLTLDILNSLQSHSLPVYLLMACVSEVNDAIEDGIHKPRIYGIGVRTKSGKLFHAAFPEKGPDEYLRHARIYGSREMSEVYSSTTGEFNVQPISGVVRSDVIRHFLQMPDDWILKETSTSPECEPPYFVTTIRKTFELMLQHQEPLKTLFPRMLPRTYHRDCHGNWVLQPK